MVFFIMYLSDSQMSLSELGKNTQGVEIAQSVQWLGCELDDQSSIPGRGGEGIYLFTTAFRPLLEPTHPLIRWVSGVLSLGLKRPGSEADNSPPSSAEIKNAWSCTSTPRTSSWYGTWLSIWTTLSFTSWSNTLRGAVAQYSVYATGRTSGVRFLAGAGNFSHRHRVYTSTGPHQTSYQWERGVIYPRG
jgi:hypothetical protein